MLQIKEKLLEERKMSPAQRLFGREIEPRFSSPEGKKETKRRRNNSQIYLYDDLLQREKHTLGQLKDKARSRQIVQLTKKFRALHQAKQVKGSLQSLSITAENS